MASDSRVLLLEVSDHLVNLVDWVELRREIPVPAVTTAVESYLMYAGEHSPTLMTEEMVFPVLAPMNVGQITSDILGLASVVSQGDNASHEDFALMPELYLFS